MPWTAQDAFGRFVMPFTNQVQDEADKLTPEQAIELITWVRNDVETELEELIKQYREDV